MCRASALLAGLTVLCPAIVSADPPLINGSFEKGDLSGWTLSVDMLWWNEVFDDYGNYVSMPIDANDLPFSYFDECAFMRPHADNLGRYVSKHGDFHVEIPGNSFTGAHSYYCSDYYQRFPPEIFGYFSTPGIGTISARQEISLSAGDVLSGWVGLYTQDYPPYNWDSASVVIGNSSFTDEAVRVSVMDACGDLWYQNCGNEAQSSPWIYWSWTAPAAGVYTVSLNNRMDDQEESVAVFDGLRIRRAPPKGH